MINCYKNLITSALLFKKIDSEPIYNGKHLRTKIKPYESNINVSFHYNGISKECSYYICLSIVLIACFFKLMKIILR